MSLRDDVARELHDAGCGCKHGPDPRDYGAADAVLAVVGERLLGDEAVGLASERLSDLGAVGGAHPENLRGASRRLLAAAWAAACDTTRNEEQA